MNEQLVVKNFGPIKDATVDFKRVTVFIGPTGGGKSTLAKLAAVFRDNDFMDSRPKEREVFFKNYSIDKYMKLSTSISWGDERIGFIMGKDFGSASPNIPVNRRVTNADFLKQLTKEPGFLALLDSYNEAKLETGNDAESQMVANNIAVAITKLMTEGRLRKEVYIPTERMFLPAVEYSWAGMLRDDIGLPKVVLNFANLFSIAKSNIKTLSIPFLNVKYIHRNGQDFIKIPQSKIALRLYETASGIQSVTPLLVLLEHLSQNTEQAQSFIIEEPELNLYPTAQQGLLNWLVEKCTKGENDLTITTHSPYILSHLNLLLYAYQVAEQHPSRAEEVAKLVPRESWINPAEFACYQVEDGGVTSLVNADLELIDDNGLDNLSGDAADAFDNLIRLSKGVALK